MSFFFCRKVLQLASNFVSALLMLLVFFVLRSSGLYFLFRYSFLKFSRWFWVITVRTCAIDFRTTLLYQTVTEGTRGLIHTHLLRVSLYNRYHFLLYLNSGVVFYNRTRTYILDNFEAVPPVTLCTLSCDSSVFSSSSCFMRSSLDLPLNSWAFSFPYIYEHILILMLAACNLTACGNPKNAIP